MLFYGVQNPEAGGPRRHDVKFCAATNAAPAGFAMNEDFRPRHDEERQWRSSDADGPLASSGLPMSPAMRACLQAQLAGLHKLAVLALPILAGLLAIWIFWGGAHLDGWLLLGVVVLVAAVGYVAKDWRGLRQDLAAGTFSRYSGAWTPVQTDRNWYIRLPDGSRFKLADQSMTFFPPPEAGEIDFATHSRVMFEIRNAEGHVVRRNSAYRP